MSRRALSDKMIHAFGIKLIVMQLMLMDIMS